MPPADVEPATGTDPGNFDGVPAVGRVVSLVAAAADQEQPDEDADKPRKGDPRSLTGTTSARKTIGTRARASARRRLRSAAFDRHRHEQRGGTVALRGIRQL